MTNPEQRLEGTAKTASDDLAKNAPLANSSLSEVQSASKGMGHSDAHGMFGKFELIDPCAPSFEDYEPREEEIPIEEDTTPHLDPIANNIESGGKGVGKAAGDAAGSNAESVGRAAAEAGIRGAIGGGSIGGGRIYPLPDGRPLNQQPDMKR